jgi:hypothetical protein
MEPAVDRHQFTLAVPPRMPVKHPLLPLRARPLKRTSSSIFSGQLSHLRRSPDLHGRSYACERVPPCLFTFGGHQAVQHQQVHPSNQAQLVVEFAQSVRRFVTGVAIEFIAGSNAAQLRGRPARVDLGQP